MVMQAGFYYLSGVLPVDEALELLKGNIETTYGKKGPKIVKMNQDCVDMTVETTVKLSKHANVVGLKDATGANNRVGPLRAVCGAGFRQYSGEDGMARGYVLQGGEVEGGGSGAVGARAGVLTTAAEAPMRSAHV